MAGPRHWTPRDGCDCVDCRAGGLLVQPSQQYNRTEIQELSATLYELVSHNLIYQIVMDAGKKLVEIAAEIHLDPGEISKIVKMDRAALGTDTQQDNIRDIARACGIEAPDAHPLLGPFLEGCRAQRATERQQRRQQRRAQRAEQKGRRGATPASRPQGPRSGTALDAHLAPKDTAGLDAGAVELQAESPPPPVEDQPEQVQNGVALLPADPGMEN